jgi:Cu+-exporting ATPase
MSTLKAKVIGMSCVSCANTIERVLKSQGIDAHIEFTSAIAYINTDDESKLKKAKEKLNSLGYDILVQESNDEFIKKEKKNLILSWIFSIPIFIKMALMPFGIHIENHTIDLALFIISSIIVIFFGRQVHKSGIGSLVVLAPNMDSLISIGTIVSLSTYILSIFLPIGNFSSESAVIMNIFLLGNYIKNKSTVLASSKIEKLYSLIVSYANTIIDGNEVKVNIENVNKGDIIIVKPGEIIPLDGVIIKGSSYIDESSITGEPLPKPKTIGDRVLGGTMNIDGYIEVRVEKEYKDTVIKKIVDFVEKSESTKLKIQSLIDKVVLYFVPSIFVISILVFGIWLIQGDTSKALVASISILVIACPCALGLAVPLAIKVGFGILATKGILIKNPETIEKIVKVNTVVFDKTGTLTEGKPKVKSTNLPEDILKLVSAIESKVNHPLSTAIIEFSKSIGLEFSNVNVENIKNVPGKGIEGTANGITIRIFKPDKEMENSNGTISIVYILENNNFIEKGYIEFEDNIKENVKEVIEYLKNKEIGVFLVTGDNEVSAKRVSREIGIPENNVFCNMLPDEKVNAIRKLREEGKNVMFVGDGINDAPSIKESFVGVAMSTGSDITSELGDVIIVGSRIKALIDLFEVSKMIHRKIIQNLFYAFIYNIIAIPIAGLGLLTPGIAQLIMSISSISVVINSLLVKSRNNSH